MCCLCKRGVHFAEAAFKTFCLPDPPCIFLTFRELFSTSQARRVLQLLHSARAAMGLNRSALGMALVACCSGALLGAQWPGLNVAGAADASSQALDRFTGWQAWAPNVLVASLLAWGITRCGQVWASPRRCCRLCRYCLPPAPAAKHGISFSPLQVGWRPRQGQSGP